MYAAYREKGVELMLHLLQCAQWAPTAWTCSIPVRCPRAVPIIRWAVANNSSHPYSNWASFAPVPTQRFRQLPKNRPGMLTTTSLMAYPRGLMHNHQPMRLAPDQNCGWVFEHHSRQKDGRSEPKIASSSILCWCAANTGQRRRMVLKEVANTLTSYTKHRPSARRVTLNSKNCVPLWVCVASLWIGRHSASVASG